MEKHLWILRHATAEYPKVGGTDYKRNLTPQGLEEAHAVGQWLSNHSVGIDTITASPALRTQQTAEVVGQKLEFSANNIKYDDHIYEADADSLVDVILGIPDTSNHALLVGHNPGLESLLHVCLGNYGAPGLFLRPASLAHIVFPQFWDEALGGLGEFKGIFHARD